MKTYFLFVQLKRDIHIDLYTSGLHAGVMHTTWYLRYQLNEGWRIQKTSDEFESVWTSLTLQVYKSIDNNTDQQLTSWANTLIFRPSLTTLFEATQAGRQASSADVYLCEWIYYVLLKRFNQRPSWVVQSSPTRNNDRMS